MMSLKFIVSFILSHLMVIGSGFPLEDGMLPVASNGVYHSCKDLRQVMGRTLQSGVHKINLPSGEYEVYCEMGINGGGYTFIPSKIIDLLHQEDMQYLFRDPTSVLLRMSMPDGTQPYTAIQRLNAKGALSVQLSNSIGYTQPINRPLGAFIFLGTIPAKNARNNDEQGFISNGKMLTFKNGDKNPNSYFAFYPNPTEKKMSSYFDESYEKEGICVNWRGSGIRPYSGRRMPVDYFLLTEMHFGGGGCYTSSERWMSSVHPAHGVAVGVR